MESTAGGQAVLELIAIERLHDHPQNPRLSLRQDVVDALAANLEGGNYPQQHALLVRANDDGYQILSGHHRKAAALAAGLTHVWCWVDDLDDDEAYMALAVSNNQGELSPLEIGLHALRCVELGKAGRGKAGGLREYARRIGRQQSNITQLRKAAQVAQELKQHCFNLQDKAFHLAAIADLDEANWEAAVEVLLAKGMSVSDTTERVKSAKEGTTTVRQLALFKQSTTAKELERIDSLVASVADSVRAAAKGLAESSDKSKRLIADRVNDLANEWTAWAKKEDPVDIKVVQHQRIEFEDRLQELLDLDVPDRPNLVLADPPWRYEFSETDSRQIENQYPSATVEEICGHVPATADDCVLLLWATAPKLPEALQVVDAWGFTYKTHAVWDKEKIGMGYWFRGQHELLLVATKGKAAPPDSGARVSSVFREPRQEHSRKPACVYEWIEEAFRDHVKLEMYCRTPREGWLVHGIESRV